MNFAPQLQVASHMKDSSSEEPSAAQLPLQSSHITPPQSENDYQPECPTTVCYSQCDSPPQQTSFHSKDPIPIPSYDEANPVPVPPLAHQQTPAAVVKLQPFSGTTMPPAQCYPIYHVYGLSISLNVIFLNCCILLGFVFSLPALLFSIQAKKADKEGDYRRAKFHFRVSVGLNIVAIFVWSVSIGAVVGFICYLRFVVLPEALSDDD